MKKYNVLVTGIGAIIGYGLINSLRNCKYDVHIIGMDIYDDAYGQYLCDEFIQAIPAADLHYPEFLMNLIDEKNIDLVLFGVEQEAIRIAEDWDKFENYRNKIVVNKPDIIELSQDKWKTFLFLNQNGMDAIPSMIEGDYQEFAEKLGSPFLLKPRRSYASKGIEIIHSEKELAFYRERVGDQFMVQKIIGDKEHEYTAGAFCDGKGGCNEPIIMKRRLSAEGATVKAEVIHCPEIAKAIYELAAILKPVGPTNFQFRKDNDKYLLLEINPRVSSSTSLRAAFGYNEAEMCIEYYVEGKRPSEQNIQLGSAVRYIADYIIR